MAKKKITRKQLKEPDEFITLTSRAIEWCRLHPKQLTYIGAAVLAIVIMVFGLRTFYEYRSRAAFALLNQAMNRIQVLEEKEADALASVEPDFKRLLSLYSHQSAGQLGRIIFAHAQLTRGSADAAIELYHKALADYRRDPSLAVIIQNGLASAYEQKNMNAEAIGHYENIVQSTGTMLKDSALFHLGRLYQLTGNTEKSDRAYAQLAAEFPESVYTPMVETIPAG